MLITAFLAQSPLTEFKSRWAACEADKNLIASSYTWCVMEAGAAEQKEFHQHVDGLIRDKLVTDRRLSDWEKARDKRCKRVSRATPYPYFEVVEAGCRARADDHFLKSNVRKSH